nr:glycosyltransferase BC10-like [Ipomoea batatas]
MASKSLSIFVHSFLLFMLGLSVGIISTSYRLNNFSSFPFTVPASIFSVSTPSSSLSSPQSPPPLLPLNASTKLDDKNKSLEWHNMTDDELLRLAASSAAKTSKDVAKVAFMFLTPGPLPLAPLWEKFFEGHQHLFSIYIHAHPSYNQSFPDTSVFYGRTIPSQPVSWGTISMIDAERRLLANALLDLSNQRFVLLSDSCIPLFNFTTTYHYLMASTLSFLQSYDDPRKPGRGRYTRRMSPAITLHQWRKGSQWFQIRRDLAAKIVSDQKYYPVFRDHCLPPCYSDEHYLPTLVNILWPDASSNRSVTWVDWSRGGSHPRKFGWIDVKVGVLDKIRFGGKECVYNGNTTRICFLFARKFLPNTSAPLLRLAPSLLA